MKVEKIKLLPFPSNRQMTVICRWRKVFITFNMAYYLPKKKEKIDIENKKYTVLSVNECTPTDLSENL